MLNSETELLASLLSAIRHRLPRGWTLEPEQLLFGRNGPDATAALRAVDWDLTSGLSARKNEPDATAVLRDPDGTSTSIIIEVKNRAVEARDVPSIADTLRQNKYQQYDRAQEIPLLLCLFVGEGARSKLRDSEINYIDTTGNSRIVIDRPAVFIETTGAQKNPHRETDKPLLSLKGAGAGRAVRALCDFEPPYGVRQLAICSGATGPTISRVAELLDREQLVQRSEGRIIDTDWQGILRRWSKDYVLFVRGKYFSYLEPRGLAELSRKVEQLGKDWALTGSLAVQKHISTSATRLALVYVPHASVAAKDLRLVETESGANVILVEPFDPVVFSRMWVTEERDRCAAATQVAVDLMVSPGRGPAEAEALLKWMQENTSKWRSSCK